MNLKQIYFISIILFIVLGSSCQTTTPTNEPAPIAVATETEISQASPTQITTLAATQELQTVTTPSGGQAISTNIPIPATTATNAPEPATVTVQPTSTTKPDPTNTPTEEPEATETIASATIAATTTSNANSEEPTTTAQPATAPPPPPPSGNVPAPTDNNYPGNDDRFGWENRINVPSGFNVSYIGRIEGNPTSITFGPDGLLYAANQQGSIYTMDSNGNVGFYAGGFNTPTGIAFRPGTSQLYVSDRTLNENVGGESQISIVGQGQIVGGLPC